MVSLLELALAHPQVVPEQELEQVLVLELVPEQVLEQEWVVSELVWEAELEETPWPP